jgi:carbonic anhydrase/acetyltransferase-like protein (isoleucine patch superfamily)
VSLTVHWLRAVHAVDQLRFAAFRRWHGAALEVEDGASPNLRFARIRLGPGASLHIGTRFATERQPGNHFWIQQGGRVELASDVWLRTEHAPNRFTSFPGARIRLGKRALINGAMIHAKAAIEIGDDSMVGFGSRIFDADLHPLDVNTPERIEPIRIGERVWIGSDVTVTRGVTIGDDAVVGARSVVTRDIPPRSLAVGTPAKVVREIARRPTLES